MLSFPLSTIAYSRPKNVRDYLCPSKLIETNNVLNLYCHLWIFCSQVIEMDIILLCPFYVYHSQLYNYIFGFQDNPIFTEKEAQKMSIFSAKLIFQNIKHSTVDHIQYPHTVFYLYIYTIISSSSSFCIIIVLFIGSMMDGELGAMMLKFSSPSYPLSVYSISADVFFSSFSSS